MLPMPSRDELRARLPRLSLGLLGFGLGIALMVHADLGLGPWDVLHQGISRLTGIPIGTVGILVGLLLLVAWLPLRERMGIGTIANVLVIGVIIDVVLWLLPDVSSMAVRVPELAVGVLLIGMGSGAYIGAGLGPGPRDGLMTSLAARGVGSVRTVRTGIEVTVLALGFLLGGSVGVGTVLQALAIGPIVQWFLERLSLPPLVPTAVAGLEVDPGR